MQQASSHRAPSPSSRNPIVGQGLRVSLTGETGYGTHRTLPQEQRTARQSRKVRGLLSFRWESVPPGRADLASRLQRPEID